MAKNYRADLLTESVSAVTATPSVELGTTRLEGGNEYVYMYNGETAADKGLMVTIDPAGTGYDTFTVSTVADNLMVGVVANATMAASTYGWIQRRGRVTLKSATVSSTTYMFCVGANGTAAICSGASNPAGILLEVASGSTGVKAYLK